MNTENQEWDKSQNSQPDAQPLQEREENADQEDAAFDAAFDEVFRVQGQLVPMQVSLIRVATENSGLYDNFGAHNQDDQDLAVSIRDEGIREPLVVTADQVLLSGHRRLAAARMLRLEMVPVRILYEQPRYENLSAADRLKLLRLFNQQREKTPAEKIREKLLEIDPAAAHAELRQRRAELKAGAGLPKTNVAIGNTKKRSRITTLRFLAKVKEIAEENRKYWPLTVRRVHYLLLSDPPPRHDSKPGRYENNQACYKALTNLLARARLERDIPWEAIEDSTRPVQLGNAWDTMQEFVKDELDRFLVGYRRNLMQGQPHHIEIMLEKNALRTVVEEVALEYCIPMTTGRGHSSLGPRAEIASRFRNSGKASLILLMLTDFDPDGEEIAAAFARSLQSDFGIRHITPIKVALTAEDIAQHNLPSDLEAKVTSPNYKKFLARHKTTRVVELDAAPVPMLQDKLRQAIHQAIDIEAFNHQVELEQQDAAQLQATRQTVLEAIKGAI